MDLAERFNQSLGYWERQGEEPLMFWVASDVMEELEEAHPPFRYTSVSVCGYPVFVDKALRKGTIRTKCKRRGLDV